MPDSAPIAERLANIRVLFRQSDVMALWGIPYDMRPGQSPADIRRAHDNYRAPAYGHYGAKQVDLSDWVWLGNPGWWYNMSAEDTYAIRAWLARLPEGTIPGGPNEWCTLHDSTETIKQGNPTC